MLENLITEARDIEETPSILNEFEIHLGMETAKVYGVEAAEAAYDNFPNIADFLHIACWMTDCFTGEILHYYDPEDSEGAW